MSVADQDFLVLCAVEKLSPNAYGYRIQRWMRDCAGIDLKLPAIYKILDRQLRDGLVDRRVERVGALHAGSRKAFIQLTVVGRETFVVRARDTKKQMTAVMRILDDLERGKTGESDERQSA